MAKYKGPPKGTRSPMEIAAGLPDTSKPPPKKFQTDQEYIDAGFIRTAKGGWIKPFPKGHATRRGKQPNNYTSVLKIMRQFSPEAARNLIDLAQNSKDPKVRLVANEKIIERAWGKPKEPTEAEMKDSERKLNIAALLKVASMEELTAMRSLFARMKEMQDEADAEADADFDADYDENGPDLSDPPQGTITILPPESTPDDDPQGDDLLDLPIPEE